MIIGFKNLIQEKTRLAVSAGGLAVAIILILVLNGLFAGSEQQVTAYMSQSPGADVWVAQKDVSNMHMTTSVLPAAKLKEVEAITRVRSVSPILYLATTAEMNGERQFTYISGFDGGSKAGGPWQMQEGRRDLKQGEAIVDAIAAQKKGVTVGDDISIMGKRFKIAGLSGDTYSIANTFTFVSLQDLARLTGATDRYSYLIVETDGDASAVAADIEREVASVSALTRAEFITSERRLIRQMGVDLINITAVIGFIIGLVVVGLTMYTLTMERTREFGVMKAIGAGRFRLYRIVFEQSALCVFLGLLLGLVLAFVLRSLIEYFVPELKIVYPPDLLIRVAGALVVIGFVASYLPIRRIVRVDPMIVFKS